MRNAGHCWSNESYHAALPSPAAAAGETHSRVHPSHAPKCTHAYAVTRAGARRLVEHLLDLSRLDNGVVPLHARKFEVWPYLAGVLKEANMSKGQGHARTDVHLHLDVTPPGLDKGRFVDWMAGRLGIPAARIATSGRL